jgi:hypothetical protein
MDGVRIIDQHGAGEQLLVLDASEPIAGEQFALHRSRAVALPRVLQPKCSGYINFHRGRTCSWKATGRCCTGLLSSIACARSCVASLEQSNGETRREGRKQGHVRGQ